MTAETPPTGTGTGKVPSPPGRGATPVVRNPDDDALVTALFCCTPFPRHRWCLRVKGHAGGCIAWGPFPLKHTDDHTTYRRTA